MGAQAGRKGRRRRRARRLPTRTTPTSGVTPRERQSLRRRPAGANYTRPDGREGEAEGPPKPPPPDPETPRDANYSGPSGQPEVAPAPPPAPPGPGPRSLDDGKNYSDETGRAVRAEDLPAKPIYRAPEAPA